MGGPGSVRQSGPGGVPAAATTTAPRRLLLAACAVSGLTVAALLCAIGARSGGGVGDGTAPSRRGLVRRHPGGGRRAPPPPPRGPAGRRTTGGGRPDDGGGGGRDPAAGDFFERNGLAVPPPVLPRRERLGEPRTRPTSRRRNAEEGSDGDRAEGAGGGEEAGGGKADTASPTPADESPGYDASTRLRRELLDPETYDRHAYPWSYAWAGQPEGNRTGVPVEVGINFHRVFSVDVINPVLDIIAWMRIEWVDPRLTWDPLEYGNLNKTWMWIGEGGSGGETSEIWTPDLELWNLDEGLRESFDDAYAIVQNTGAIYWSRPGHLRPACKFGGLVNFPFDMLTCTMEFGSWAYSGKYLRPVPGGGTGFSMGGSDTAGQSYNEFSFAEDEAPVVVTPVVYPPYPSSPEEDWPVIKYTVSIERSWQPYARGYIMMQILLNVIGFSAFWLPPSCGERMGLSISALLAATFAELAISVNLPSAAEYTWIQKFSIMSMSFTFISLLECIVVLYFYYKRSKDFAPWWWGLLMKWSPMRRAGELCAGAVWRLRLVVSGRARGHSHPDPTARHSDSFHDNGLRPGLSAKRMSLGGLINHKLDDLSSTADEPKVVEGETVDRPTPPMRRLVKKRESLDSSVSSTEGRDKVGQLQSQAKLDASEASQRSLNLSDLAGNPSTDKQEGANGTGTCLGVIETANPLAVSMISMSNSSFEDRPKSVKPIIRQGRRRGSTETNDVSSPGVDDGLAAEPCDDNQDQAGSRVTFDDPNKLNLSRRLSWMNDYQEMVSSVRAMAAEVAPPRDADDFNDQEEMVNNKKWKVVAGQVDDLARVLCPVAFAVAIAIIMGEIGNVSESES